MSRKVNVLQRVNQIKKSRLCRDFYNMVVKLQSADAEADLQGPDIGASAIFEQIIDLV